MSERQTGEQQRCNGKCGTSGMATYSDPDCPKHGHPALTPAAHEEAPRGIPMQVARPPAQACTCTVTGGPPEGEEWIRDPNCPIPWHRDAPAAQDGGWFTCEFVGEQAYIYDNGKAPEYDEYMLGDTADPEAVEALTALLNAQARELADLRVLLDRAIVVNDNRGEELAALRDREASAVKGMHQYAAERDDLRAAKEQAEADNRNLETIAAEMVGRAGERLTRAEAAETRVVELEAEMQWIGRQRGMRAVEFQNAVLRHVRAALTKEAGL